MVACSSQAICGGSTVIVRDGCVRSSAGGVGEGTAGSVGATAMAAVVGEAGGARVAAS